MRRRRALAALMLAAILLVAGLAYALLDLPPQVRQPAAAGRPPTLQPDYSDTVFPPNIAAPSFVVEEKGTAYVVEVRGEHGEPVRTWNSGAGISLPLGPWRKLLDENRGASLEFLVWVRGADGRWTEFEPVRNRIAREKIDPYIVYRRIGMLYNYYTYMQIRERNLEDYTEKIVLDNRSFGTGCMNCHTFCRNSPERMAMQIRSGRTNYGGGMLLIEDGRVTKVNTSTKINPGLATFASWHPSGRVIAFSISAVRQFFHTRQLEVRDFIETAADVAVYVVDSGEVTSTKAIARPDRLETWPAWSADGKYLYFVSSPVPWEQGQAEHLPPPHYQDLVYDLMRIRYDVDSGAWGEPETVLSARKTGLSITEPRPSPDGRFILVCMSRYSAFPALQRDADIYMVDPTTGDYRRLPCDSDESESWHSWSSNSRWFAFSTKAGNGLFSRAGFCYVGEDGTVHKPFLLPQRDPRFYESCISLFQLPELIKQPVPVPGDQIGAAIRSAQWEGVGLPVTSATPAAAP